jgi:pimeloyl-ACP methyl ester carboxylesterase
MKVKGVFMFSYERSVIYLGTVLFAIICTGAITFAQSTATESRNAKPDIVLVHGAYADGTSWSKVIALLQAKGYNVVSVQNPTTSLADDVAATERAINQQNGPVVLVGHSWAGVVITQAGNNPKVQALVYVDAAAPDSGQSILDSLASGPAEPGASAGVKDANDFILLPRSAVEKYFAQDLSPAERGIIWSTQTPWGAGCLTDKVTKAAWHDKPSWWVIGEHDHMISPVTQAKMAATLKAKVTKLPTSHLAMLADPKSVTNVIVEAADKVQTGTSAAPASVAEAVDDSGLNKSSRSSAAVSAALNGVASARDLRGPAGVVALSNEPLARLIIDPPLADSLAHGRIVIQYRAENVRIEQDFGTAALKVSPRIGHIHVTVDDAAWHWLDASGEPLVITGLTSGPHKVLIELVNAAHQTLDYGVVAFNVPMRSLTANDPHADGFAKAPDYRVIDDRN